MQGLQCGSHSWCDGKDPDKTCVPYRETFMSSSCILFINFSLLLSFADTLDILKGTHARTNLKLLHATIARSRGHFLLYQMPMNIQKQQMKQIPRLPCSRVDRRNIRVSIFALILRILSALLFEILCAIPLRCFYSAFSFYMIVTSTATRPQQSP